MVLLAAVVAMWAAGKEAAMEAVGMAAEARVVAMVAAMAAAQWAEVVMAVAKAMPAAREAAVLGVVKAAAWVAPAAWKVEECSEVLKGAPAAACTAVEALAVGALAAAKARG